MGSVTRTVSLVGMWSGVVSATCMDVGAGVVAGILAGFFTVLLNIIWEA